MQETKVLDKGYVKLTGTLLSEDDDKDCAKALDDMVVETARVSYGSGLKGPEKDKKLLHYLLEHEHGTPFESAVFRFEIKLPLFCMQQFLRHRWSSFNQISGRYTDEIADEFYMPEVLRAQDVKNKQGSTEAINPGIDLTENEASSITQCKTFSIGARNYYQYALESQQAQYAKLVLSGVAKELARGILGSAFYTKFVWTVNARSLINFFVLRCDEHAQYETRLYSWAIFRIVEHKMPWLCEGLLKYFPTSFVNEPK